MHRTRGCSIVRVLAPYIGSSHTWLLFRAPIISTVLTVLNSSLKLITESFYDL